MDNSCSVLVLVRASVGAVAVWLPRRRHHWLAEKDDDRGVAVWALCCGTGGRGCGEVEDAEQGDWTEGGKGNLWQSMAWHGMADMGMVFWGLWSAQNRNKK